MTNIYSQCRTTIAEMKSYKEDIAKRTKKTPLEIVIEDNGASVYTDTKKTWNIKKLDFPKDVFYYNFKMGYPHHGTGKWVSF